MPELWAWDSLCQVPDSDYAIDYDQDGHVNLFNNPYDAIGSVANYFKAHGWIAGRGIYYPVHVNNANVKELLDKNWDLTPQELYASGATTKVNLSYVKKLDYLLLPLKMALPLMP